MTTQPLSSHDNLKYAFGSTLKMVGDNRIGGYLITFTDTDNRDLDDEYFDKSTDLATPHDIVGMPLLFQHGLDPRLKDIPIGKFDKANVDEHGLWAEAILNERKQYEDFVNKWYADKDAPLTLDDYEKAVRFFKGLVKSARMDYSSGANPNTAIISKDGHIQKWSIFEGSATHTPADPKNARLYSLKSILDIAQDIDYKEPIEAKDSENPSAVDVGLRGDGKRDNKTEDIISEGSTMSQEKTVKMLSEEELNSIVEMVMSRMQTKMDGEMDDEEIKMTEEEIKSVASQVQVDSESAEDITQKALSSVLEALPAIINKHMTAKTKRDAEIDKAFDDSLKGVLGESKVKGGSHAPKAIGNLQVSSKYAHWTAEDFSFAVDLNRKLKTAGLPTLPIELDDKFYREFADKTTKSSQSGDVYISSGVSKSVSAIKADEVMYSTQSGFGDEHVPEMWRDQIWLRARRDNVVLPQFESFDMPSNPYVLPIEGADATVYKVPEATNQAQMNLAASVFPDSKVATANTTITASKIGLQVFISTELQEDAVSGAIPRYRAQSTQAMLDAVDNIILNGDTATSNNINLDGGTPGATDAYTLFNGLIKNPLVTATSNAVNGLTAAPTLQSIRSTRFKLDRSKQSVGELAIFVSPEVEHHLLNMDEFTTMDKAGARATAQTGVIGFVDNIPVLVTNEMALADTDGKITDGGNVTDTGRLLIVHTGSWYVGYRRQVQVSLQYIPYLDAWVLTSTLRFGFINQDNDSASLLYNIKI